MIQINEKNLEEIKNKLNTIRSDLNKIEYLESIFKKDFSIDIKRFALTNLISLYEKNMMYEKAARVLSTKARFDTTFREKIEDYIESAKFFCKVGKIDDAEEMFSRASREANEQQRKELFFKKKQMYLEFAEYLEKTGKRSSSLRFYEILIKIPYLTEEEKTKIKEKLSKTYKLLGRFREAETISKL